MARNADSVISHKVKSIHLFKHHCYAPIIFSFWLEAELNTHFAEAMWVVQVNLHTQFFRINQAHCENRQRHIHTKFIIDIKTDRWSFSAFMLSVECNEEHLGHVSHFIFLWESQFYGSGVLAKVWDAKMWEFYARAIICLLLLINGIDITILWVALAKRSKEISCSRNLVTARDFYDVRRTFYASSFENLVEKCETCLWTVHSSTSTIPELQY